MPIPRHGGRCREQMYKPPRTLWMTWSEHRHREGGFVKLGIIAFLIKRVVTKALIKNKLIDSAGAHWRAVETTQVLCYIPELTYIQVYITIVNLHY